MKKKKKGKTSVYIHKDVSGVLWWFSGGRPISSLADKVMQDIEELREREGIL